MTFLPPNYEKPVGNSKYYKFSNGDNCFRILSSAITGWVIWNDEINKPDRSPDIIQGGKHFWAFVIYDYRTKAIKILEVTQATIQDAIYSLHMNESWGNPSGYDINVNRKGENLETKYNVIPSPPAEVGPEISKLYATVNVNLDKLFENGDPFGEEEQTLVAQQMNEAMNNQKETNEIPM